MLEELETLTIPYGWRQAPTFFIERRIQPRVNREWLRQRTRLQEKQSTLHMTINDTAIPPTPSARQLSSYRINAACLRKNTIRPMVPNHPPMTLIPTSTSTSKNLIPLPHLNPHGGTDNEKSEEGAIYP
jgi:hypothetical protein